MVECGGSSLLLLMRMMRMMAGAIVRRTKPDVHTLIRSVPRLQPIFAISMSKSTHLLPVVVLLLLLLLLMCQHELCIVHRRWGRSRGRVRVVERGVRADSGHPCVGSCFRGG